MTGFTLLSKREISDIVADYGLPKALAARPARLGSVDTHYLLETAKGKFVLKIDEVKSEIEVKREQDLFAFLRKHGLPCPVPLADRNNRHYRDRGGKPLSVYRHIEGRVADPEYISLGQLENVGRVLADLHLIGKGYKKGIENRFGFDRVSEIYFDVRGRLPHYFKKITRTLDDEVEYLHHYLEGKLPKGIIHGGLTASSLLFKGDKVAAILDFETACRGKFIYDLAAAINTLCFETSQGYSLKKFEALIAGYEALRTLSLAEWDAFPNELRFAAFRHTITRLRDFFLNPDDDERQRINKEFQDFYDRLRILRREREGGMEALLMAMATGYDYRKYQKVKAVAKRR
ncbi:MAG: homoserine kinase [Deltaproteobacteria bacterium]|nr:homoserine kinase [Deltaproteobacteria bacterium]